MFPNYLICLRDSVFKSFIAISYLWFYKAKEFMVKKYSSTKKLKKRGE